jgi:sugar lactone lactonase YvrE
VINLRVRPKVAALPLFLVGVALGAMLLGRALSEPQAGEPAAALPGRPAEEGKQPFPGRALVAAFFPEGPCFVAGKLHYVDYSGHSVMTWDGQNPRRLWYRDKTGPSGLLPLKDGTLLVACYDKGTLVQLDASGKEVSVTENPDGPRFNGPNDLAMDPSGGVYFSTSGEWRKEAKAEGKVYYLSKTGKVSKVADGIHYANGLVVVEGGKRLLVAEMLEGRVLQYTIGEEGKLSHPSVWKRLAEIQPGPKDADWSTGPDGLKTDSKGNIYICQFGAARILVTRPDGTWLRTIPVPLKGVTNVAFGPGEKTVYVTAVKDAAEPYLGAVYEIPNR